jgi:EAL domain-containing protein (putative c-di-GMP-specific phosphodiesterase class I)
VRDVTAARAMALHPTREQILPAQFIPVAEDCGLILPIGHWVLREACKQARAWADAGPRLTTVAVNISAREFVRARGVQIAVDDFGTGYSSLSYLTKFSINTIKIDQSFVCKITTTPNEATIVTAIISMGRSLKMRVAAEGVETQEEQSFLQAHQCEEAQGYHFSRPVLPQQFAKLLETGKLETAVH